ncbi:hypothetical protein QJS10_CPB15g01860 [Acorus calamus]|uniref:Reverse transcriptase zinc-binding domain-containing protein n=1 Tax=Acorus calamus TaxID=4465 RepID=A0AAV9D6K9_ACOCL|nr:hypothetical protein QJS10_CPB15g01860 [Acorus calamus]
MDEPYITHQSNPIYMEISGGANNRCSFKKAWGGFGAVKGTGEVGDVEIPAAYHGWPDTIIASSSCNASPTFVDGCCYVHSWFGSVRKNDEAISLDSTIWQETNTSNMLGQDYRLSDVVSQGEWNIPILQLIFPDYWVQVISESPVPRDDPTKPFCWCWEASDVDIPQTRDIFNVVYPFNGDTFDRGWRHLWRLPVLPKLKNFMWKVLWERLPTRVYLDSIGMHMDNRCPMCEAVPETVFHLFAECKYAAEVYLPKLPSTPTFMAKKQLEYIVSPSFVEE